MNDGDQAAHQTNAVDLGKDGHGLARSLETKHELLKYYGLWHRIEGRTEHCLVAADRHPALLELGSHESHDVAKVYAVLVQLALVAVDQVLAQLRERFQLLR